MKLTFIHGEREVTAEFPQVRAFFERVVDGAAKGEFSTDDIEELAKAKRATLGIVKDAGEPVLAFAFEFIYYPRMVVLNVLAMGGRRLGEVMGEFWPNFTAWAREAGADSIQASCSPAVARILAKHGFEATYQVVRSKL